MIHRIAVDLSDTKAIEIELDDTLAPKTISSILKCLPISVGIHVWGEEIYTDPIPVVEYKENQKALVNLMDVAYWPPGKAICLFFGPTPLGRNGEIRPYSPVNVIGRIKDADKSFLRNVQDESSAVFRIL